VSGKKSQNLPHARQTINMIKAVADKTKGQLTTGESKLIFRILGELQQKYVVSAGLMKPVSGETGSVHSSSHEDAVEKSLDKLSDSQLSAILSELQNKSNKNGLK
jgi:hypothetical protein